MSHSTAYWLFMLGQSDAEPVAAEPEFRMAWVIGAAVLALLAFVKRGTWSRDAFAAVGTLAVALALYGAGSPLQTIADRWAELVWSQIGFAVTRPLVWALLLGSIGMILMLPRGDSRRRVQGAAVGIVSLGFFAYSVPWLTGPAELVVFWVLAAVTLVSAAATVTMRSPVYSAIWFALSLLGTAGLFFYQGSQFLGVATVVVYAGAIVVTFLFVVMLAQPEGHATYDRLTWGASLPKPLSVIASSLLVAALAFSINGLAAARTEVVTAVDGMKSSQITSDQIVGVSRTKDQIEVEVRGVENEDLDAVATTLSSVMQATVKVRPIDPIRDVLHPSHMARLGAEMYSRRLVSVELAGTLLLAALVGAIAIIIQGKHNDLDAIEGGEVLDRDVETEVDSEEAEIRAGVAESDMYAWNSNDRPSGDGDDANGDRDDVQDSGPEEKQP